MKHEVHCHTCGIRYRFLSYNGARDYHDIHLRRYPDHHVRIEEIE